MSLWVICYHCHFFSHATLKCKPIDESRSKRNLQQPCLNFFQFDSKMDGKQYRSGVFSSSLRRRLMKYGKLLIYCLFNVYLISCLATLFYWCKGFFRKYQLASSLRMISSNRNLTVYFNASTRSELASWFCNKGKRALIIIDLDNLVALGCSKRRERGQKSSNHRRDQLRELSCMKPVLVVRGSTR